MLKLVSVAEMQEIEHQADASGLSYAEMMKNAGRGLAEVIHETFFQEGSSIFSLVGSGNNGGDALVALSYLSAWGWRVGACIVRARQADDALVLQVERDGGEVFLLGKEPDYLRLDAAVQNTDVLLDGVIGTGIQLPLREGLAGLFEHIGGVLDGLEEPPWIVAVDCPSGMDCDSGEVDERALRAQMTVTMAAVKQGMLKLPAFSYLGDLRLASIGPLEGLAAWESIQRTVVDADWVRDVLPKRPLDAHKGTFGTALIVAGSRSYTGAALLAGEAAYRTGAGLVTVGIPESLHAALAGHLPEATWLLLPEEKGGIAGPGAEMVYKNLGRTTAVLLGPGFGLEKTTLEFLENLLTIELRTPNQIGFLAGEPEADGIERRLPPVVVDADGLKLLAQIPGWADKLPETAVLTPHPGEMAVLTGMSTKSLQEDRIGSALHYAREWGHVVVLKGAFTVIASPEDRCAVIPVATPALARAGTGDVLAGMITGLRAQGLPAFEAAAAAAWMHAQAGLRAAESMGTSAPVLAGDVLGGIAEVIADIALTG